MYCESLEYETIFRNHITHKTDIDITIKPILYENESITRNSLDLNFISKKQNFHLIQINIISYFRYFV